MSKKKLSKEERKIKKELEIAHKEAELNKLEEEIQKRKKNIEPTNFEFEGNQKMPNSSSNIDEKEFEKIQQERLDRLKQINQKYATLSGLSDLESEPAYKRRDFKLDTTTHSSESSFSRFTLTDEINAEVTKNSITKKFAASRRNDLPLYFLRSEYTNDEIAEIISFISDIYKSIGGDKIVIKGLEILESKSILEPVER